MTTWTETLPISHSSDATFREWGAAVGRAFLACGWERVDLPGSVNWDTVSRPMTTGTIAGFEVFRFVGDSYADSHPLVIRLEYGTGNYSTNPGLWHTVGESASVVNGLAEIGGINTGRREWLASRYGSTAAPWYASSGAGRFVLAIRVSNDASAMGLLAVERGLTPAGAINPTKIQVAEGVAGVSWNVISLDRSSAVVAGPMRPLAACPSNNIGQIGNTLALYPIRVGDPAESMPFQSVAAYLGGLTPGLAIQATRWDGQSLRYMPLGVMMASSGPAFGGSNVTALLWD